ncbi:hypothetical protein COE03_15430, partial [Bacillus thuringiensis]
FPYTSVPSNSNLDNAPFITPGVYSSNGAAGSPVNGPNTNPVWTVYVSTITPGMGNTSILQLFISNPSIYVRSSNTNGASWNPWQQIGATGPAGPTGAGVTGSTGDTGP